MDTKHVSAVSGVPEIDWQAQQAWLLQLPAMKEVQQQPTDGYQCGLYANSQHIVPLCRAQDMSMAVNWCATQAAAVTAVLGLSAIVRPHSDNVDIDKMSQTEISR